MILKNIWKCYLNLSCRIIEKLNDIVENETKLYFYAIGYIGSTGISRQANLHYEVRKHPYKEPITFYNPADYITNIKEIQVKKKDQ